jgi:hypothetical protein
MKLANSLTLGTLTLLAVSAASAADSITVSGSPTPTFLTRDQKATNACLNAFVAQLLPNGSALVRTVIPAGGTRIFKSIAEDPQLAPHTVMDMEMSAAASKDGGLLAKSFCRVDRDAKVLRLETHVTDKAKLAALKIEDIKLAMTIR